MVEPSSPARKSRRWIYAAGLMGGVIGLGIGLRLLGSSGMGRAFVEARVESLSPAGLTIAIDGLEGDLFGRFTLDRLTLSDGEGIWLTAETVSMDWSPSALLGRTIEIEAISVSEMEVARRPVLVRGDTNDSRNGGGFLKGGRLGDLVINRLETGASLTGRPTVFSATASGALDGTNRKLVADLIPEDAIGDRLAVNLSWPRNSALSGSLNVEAPAGGLIAGLARLAPGQSLNAELDARGGGQDWALIGEADISGAPVLSIDLSRQGATMGGGAELDLSHHPITRAIGDRIGQSVTLDITETDARGEGAPHLSITANSAHLSAVISTDADDPQAPIGIVASLRNLGERLGTPALDARVVRVALMTREQPGNWSLSGDVAVDAFETSLGSIVRLAGPVSVDLTGDAPVLAIALEGEGAALDGAAGLWLGKTPSLNLRARRSEDGRAFRVDRFNLSGAHASLGASGLVSADLSQLDVEGTLQADGPASGALPFDINAQWRSEQTTRGRPDILLTGALIGFESAPPILAPTIDGGISFDSRVSLDSDGGINLRRYAINGSGFALDGTARRSADGILFLTAEATVEPIEQDTLTVEQLTVSANVEGPQDDLSISARLGSDRLKVAEQTLDDVSASASGKLRGSKGFAGRLSVETATLNGDPGPAPSLVTDISASPEAWTLSGLDVKGLGLEITGSAGAPTSAIGDIEASLQLSGAPTFAEAMQSVEASVSLEAASVEIAADARLSPIGALGGGTISLSATGDRGQANLTGQFVGTLDTDTQSFPLQLALTGQASGIDEDQLTVELTPAIRVNDLEAQAPSPWTMIRTASTGMLSAQGALNLLNGSAAFDFDQSSERSLLVSEYSGLALAPVLALFDRPVVGGVLKGRISIDTHSDQGSPRALVQGQLDGLASAGRPDTPLTLTYALDADQDQLVGNAHAENDDGLDLTARLTGKTERSAGWPGLTLDAGTPLTYAVAGSGEIEALAVLALPTEIAAAGTIDLALNGRLQGDRHSANGAITLQDGRLEHGDLGFMLTGIEAQTTLDGTMLTLESLTGSGPRGGTVDGEGAFSLTGEKSVLSISLDDLSVLDREDIEARGSGEITFQAIDGVYAIGGDVRIDRADIDPTRIEGAGYQTLDVQFNGPGAERPAAPIGNGALDLDIALEAPRRIFISGQGLDAEFGMRATISGSADDPAIRGNAEIIRGAYDFAGKRFEFEESTIAIDGDPLDATLDLRAARSADDIKAIVSITGTPRAPIIALSSEPELPQDEILSRVLFGRSPTELTELEALQLASGLASLTGRGGGFNLVGSLEDALGVDAISMGRTEDGNTSVTTGKYLSRDVYLQVRTDGVGQPTLIIEWTPRQNLEIETDLTPSEGQGASIQWQREFD